VTLPVRAPIVLVVDDEGAVRGVARRILESDHYAVIEASSGDEAVELLSLGMPVDLLVTDLDMPGLTGEELARRFRAARPGLKVLYVSGVIDRLLDARPLLGDNEAFLTKPFSHAGLLQGVALLLYETLQKPGLGPEA
jgi:two-component system, cell cycle sensor histidine kinase and response regulator CckA